MIGNGCMIGGDAATGKGVQLIGRVPIIGEHKADVTDGLIHRWRLTENVNDVVGTLHLTNNGSVTFSENGASFNGSSQWLSCTKTRPAQLTMSIWVTPVDFSARRSAFGASGSEGYPTSIWGTIASSNTLSTMLAIMCSDSYLSIANELNTVNYPTNKKTLTILTYDGANLKIYRNALLLGSLTVTAQTGSTALSIGRLGAWGGYWYGSLTDARLYSRALTANEISILAGNGPNP